MTVCCPQEKECALSDLYHQLQQLASSQTQPVCLSPAGSSAAAAVESTGRVWQVAVAARDAEIEELHCELMEVRGQHLLWVLSPASIVMLPAGFPSSLPALLMSIPANSQCPVNHLLENAVLHRASSAAPDGVAWPIQVSYSLTLCHRG